MIMMKYSLAKISLVLGIFIFLLGCSKDNHETLAFIGDESDMPTCYQIYPEQYFPTVISQELKDGMFPPDITGEYELHGDIVDGTYAMYNYVQQQYISVPLMSYKEKYLYMVVEDQINGMAKMRFALKNNSTSEYKNWFEVDAYIYGDVINPNNTNPDAFMICFENVEDGGIYSSNIANIITGKVTEDGIVDIDYWTIYKKVNS